MTSERKPLTAALSRREKESFSTPPLNEDLPRFPSPSAGGEGQGEGGLALPGFGLIERGLVPDAVLRFAIRRLLAQRLRDEQAGDSAAVRRRTDVFVAAMRESPIAIATADANAQHYEVPPAFFEVVLGRNLKYSGCLWEPATTTLDAAEDAMLALTASRATLTDGQDVLELGCGWGSLTLWMARHFPRSRITAVSNSSDQRRFIEDRARARGLGNVAVITADMNAFDPGARFDRVVSVEMFEHMRNWPRLLSRIAAWMRPDARLFLHVFSHREVAYPFDVRDASDWMAREFFTGGLMPSDGLLSRFQDELLIEERWQVDGTHYQKTAQAWLANLDTRRAEALAILGRTYGRARARERLWAWRLFFLACAECWGYRGGVEWIVSHYRLRKA
jgi:cyclopropane-fatty-acyl-phospholipid synthase